MSDDGTILTASGRYVNPLGLDPADVDIADIAHALSNQCRFSGHTRRFYSVAEHSVRVARLVKSQRHDRETVLWAVLHDAAEAYLVDLPRPLKHHESFGAVYREAERRAFEVILSVFGLPAEEPAAVKAADLVLLATERRDLMPNVPGTWEVLEGVEPLAEVVSPWGPQQAHFRFMQTFHDWPVYA